MTLALVLPFRLYVYKKTEQQLNESDSLEMPLYSMPWKAFFADLITWIVIGLLIAAIYLFYYHSFVSTFVKIAVAGLFFGIFGGMLGFLDMEGQVISILEKAGQQSETPRKMLLTVSRKMAFFMATMIFFMAFIILLVVLLDIYYLVENNTLADTGIYGVVFKEILFVFLVMLTVSLIIIQKYSRNLKRVISIQLGGAGGGRRRQL